jgi:protein-tyrosine-phosphatase/DNA-binding transcriptional ArsR family regulator
VVLAGDAGFSIKLVRCIVDAMAPSGRTATPPDFVRLAGHPLRWQLLAALADGDRRVRELVALLDVPQNLVSYHLGRLRDGGLVRATRSTFDGRDSYYHLDLDRCAHALRATGSALHPALGQPAAPSPITGGRPRRPVAVLFVCTGNSARSPMAEALLRQHAGQDVAVASAGCRPRQQLHPHTVRVLREQFGIDVADQQPRHVDSLARRRFDHVITLCDRARESCPELPGNPRRLHWSVPDPATASLSGRASYAAYRRTAADIDTRVRHLVPTLATTNRKEDPR